MKKIVLLGCLFLLVPFVFLTSSSQAATWYVGTIAQVVPRATGNTMVQILPGPSETRFSERIRVEIYSADTGGNRLLATILTAISLDKPVSFLVDNVPSWEPAQHLLGIGLVIE